MVQVSRSPIIVGDVAEVLDRDLPWERLRGSVILVTGASGMLPSYAVLVLLALNDQHAMDITVLGLVRNENKARAILGPALDRPDFSLLVQDVVDPVSVPGPVDWVIHGGSPARPSLHLENPIGTLKANVIGALNLLELATSKASRFVLMSSAEVYGTQPPGTALIGEDSYGGIDILSPRACYSEGKRAAETLAAVYQSQNGVRCHIARFGHVYGPGLALDDGRVQADFAAHVIAGDDIVLNSAGTAVRTYTYVSDAIAGMFYAMLLGEETAYNVADHDGLISIRDLAIAFTQARPVKGLKLIFSKDDYSRAYNPLPGLGLDSSKLAALGWRAVVSLPDGLERMITHLEHTQSASSAS